MLDLASKFYEMTEQEARLYFADDHRPEKSAVMDLIGEFKNEQGYIQFQCSYCKYIANSVGSLERHCYNEGQDHRDVTLRRIEDNAIAAMGKVSAELQAAIDNAIQAKQNAEHRQTMEQQQAEQAKAKKNYLSLHRPSIMSLNHSKYLRTLPSERRQVAIFQSGTVQQQLDSIRLDISLLFEMVEKLLDLHEKEHGIIQHDPITAEIIIPTAAEDQPITTTTTIKHNKDHPYL